MKTIGETVWDSVDQSVNVLWDSVTEFVCDNVWYSVNHSVARSVQISDGMDFETFTRQKLKKKNSNEVY